MNVKSLIPINVTKEEIEKIQLELCKWATPQAFARAEDIHRSKFSSSQYFKQPGLNFMMESYVASVVAEVAQYDAVRLSCPPEQAPDFYLRKGNVELAVEVGEALETGRKRGDEKWDDVELVFDPASKWSERAAQIPSQLKNAVERKLEKEYAINDLCLAIYLNIDELGIRQKMVEACLHDQTEAAK